MPTNPLLVTLSGPGQSVPDIKSLSNREVGLIVLANLARQMPGLTWGELHRFVGLDIETMGKHWYEDVGSSIMDVGRSIGGTAMDIKRSIGTDLSDSLDAAGRWAGDAVRLFTSKSVIDGLNSSYACYTSSGGYAGAITGSDGDKSSCAREFSQYADKVADNLGYNVKAKAFVMADLPPWVLPAGLGVVVILFMRRGH